MRVTCVLHACYMRVTFVLHSCDMRFTCVLHSCFQDFSLVLHSHVQGTSVLFRNYKFTLPNSEKGCQRIWSYMWVTLQRDVPGCPATVEAGHPRREEEEGYRGCRQDYRSDERPTGQSSGRQPGSAGGGDFGLPEGPPSHSGQAQSQRVGLVRLGRFDGTCYWAPGARAAVRSRVRALPAQAKGSSAQGLVVKPTASTGKEAATSGRQLSYAEVGEACAGVVVGRPGKGATAWVEGTARLPQSWRPSAEVISSQVAEAISHPNTSGFKPQRAIQPKSFSQRTRCLMGQSPTSSNNPSSETVKAFRRDKYPVSVSTPPPPVIVLRHLLPFPATLFVRRNGQT
jgi:hypothetical protein